MIRKLVIFLLFCLLMTGEAALAEFSPGEAYNLIDYQAVPADNPVARLEARLKTGEAKLEYSGEHGYLESLLDNLGIDPASQMLVFSPTSLQYKLISSETPRALYFADDIYIGYVQNSKLLEIVTIDDKLGIVFYLMNNTPAPEQLLVRETQTCLVCHDTQGTMGGGTPMLMALSGVYDTRGINLKNYSGATNISDRTPISDRWGGWYVTGHHGLQPHLGNILLENDEDLARLDDYRVWNVDTLEGAGYFNTAPYLRATSDITALLVLEHQVTVQNQLTYIKFKTEAVLKRRDLEDAIGAPTWDALPPKAQQVMSRMLDKLVKAMFFVDAAELGSRITGNPEFAAWFQGLGPNDELGRSLRQLDLEKRLFKYPLSYLIYSSDFDTIPAFAKDYVYQQIAAILEGRNDSEDFAHLTGEDRLAILEILKSTKADFVPYLDNSGQLAGARNEGSS